VLSANVPVVATYVQYVADPALNPKFGRMMYSAFDPSQAATPFYVPSVLNSQGGVTSQIGVQNVGTSQISVNLKFYPKGNPTPIIVPKTIDAQASIVFRPSEYGLPVPFNGSLVIEGSGPVVAAAGETYDAYPQAYAFEGMANAGNTLYFSTMLCTTTANQYTTFYAIQNASTTITATVSANFYNTSGAVIGTMPATAVGPGNKGSFNPCAFGVPGNTGGSAVFTSTGAPIMGIGKVVSTINGMRTAFVGQLGGYYNIAAPYIRWALDPNANFRSYVAIMNVGGSNATNIVATYYDANGTAYVHNVATGALPLAPFTKANSNPGNAGVPDNFGVSPVGGAVEISSDQPIVVVVRVQKNVVPAIGNVAIFAEDYNGVDVTP
jgi:hypothetical protein